MHETGLRADDLREVGEEGDDVVLDLALDGVDALDVEGGRAALAPDDLGRLRRYDAEGGERRRRMRLDLEPDAKARLRRPDRHHFRAAVAGNHGAVFPSAGGGHRSAGNTRSSSPATAR